MGSIGLDVRTMIFLLALGNATAFLVFFLYNVHSFADPPSRSFLAGKFLQGAGWILLGFRGRMPDLWSVFVGNVFLVFGFNLENLALACAEDLKRAWSIAFAAAACLGLVGFLAFARAPNSRVAASSVAVCLPFGLLAAAMLGRRPCTGLRVGIGLAAALYALIHLLRAGAALFGGYELGLMTLGLVQDLAFIPVFVSLMLGSIGFLFMQKERGDELLRGSEEKYRNLVELADEAIVITQDDRLVFANRRTAELLKRPMDRIVGRPFVEFLWPEDRELVLERYRSRVRGLAPAGAYDFRLDAGGQPAWVTISSSRMLWKGEPATLSLLTDIDRRKRSEERVGELLREKEVLLKEVQHRVKNNLALASSLLELQGGQGGTDAGEVLREARNRIQAMVQLYEMLQESGDFNETGIQDYFDRYIQTILQAFPPVSGLRLELDLDDLNLDVKRLTTLGIVVNEIVTNSIKYAFPAPVPAEPRILISMRCAEGKLLVRCGDNGVGLPAWVEPDTSSGLGLKLISMLAAQLGGELRIEREVGAAYCFEMPL